MAFCPKNHYRESTLAPGHRPSSDRMNRPTPKSQRPRTEEQHRLLVRQPVRHPSFSVEMNAWQNNSIWPGHSPRIRITRTHCSPYSRVWQMKTRSLGSTWESLTMFRMTYSLEYRLESWWLLSWKAKKRNIFPSLWVHLMAIINRLHGETRLWITLLALRTRTGRNTWTPTR